MFTNELAFIFLNLIFKSVAAQNGCFFAYSDFLDKEPVLLYTNFSLIEPKGEGLSLNLDEEILVACPGNSGSRNYFLNFPTNLLLVKCSQNNLVKSGLIDYNFTVFSCSKSVTGDAIPANSNSSDIVKQIGYSITPLNWATLFQIRYNDIRGDPIYSQHILYGSAILKAKKDSSRPAFKSSGLGPNVNADNAYKQKTQNSTFASLLSSTELASKYINSASYLARGHLSPDGDMVYVSAQFTTYFYINTVPQWQAINNGNWKSMEMAIRNTAAGMGKDLHIYTGGYQVLSLPDINGNNQDIYLVSDNKLSVPKYIWKIAYSSTTKEGVAFVSLNNPFQVPAAEDYLCPSICNENGWGTESWKNYTKGLLYCCDVNTLRNVINVIPNLEVTGVLKALNN